MHEKNRTNLFTRLENKVVFLYCIKGVKRKENKTDCVLRQDAECQDPMYPFSKALNSNLICDGEVSMVLGGSEVILVC